MAAAHYGKLVGAHAPVLSLSAFLGGSLVGVWEIYELFECWHQFNGQRLVTAAWATRSPVALCYRNSCVVVYVNVSAKTTFISHPFIILVLDGPGYLPAPPMVVVPTVAGHC